MICIPCMLFERMEVNLICVQTWISADISSIQNVVKVLDCHFSDWVTKGCDFSLISVLSFADSSCLFSCLLWWRRLLCCEMLYGEVYVARSWWRKTSWGMEAGSESYQQTLAEWAGKGILPSQAWSKYQKALAWPKGYLSLPLPSSSSSGIPRFVAG